MYYKLMLIKLNCILFKESHMFLKLLYNNSFDSL